MLDSPYQLVSLPDFWLPSTVRIHSSSAHHVSPAMFLFGMLRNSTQESTLAGEALIQWIWQPMAPWRSLQVGGVVTPFLAVGKDHQMLCRVPVIPGFVLHVWLWIYYIYIGLHIWLYMYVSCTYILNRYIFIMFEKTYRMYKINYIYI